MMGVARPMISLEEGHLRITDPTEGVRVTFPNPIDSSLTPTSTDQFYFPVEVAARLDTTELRLPTISGVFLMTPSGETIAQAMNKERVTVPNDEYLVRVLSLGVVCYLRVAGEIETFVEDGQRVLTFSEGTVDIGVRSRHEYPKATVETTDQPRDLMRALSCFGSALQTTSPERSWPSLRGCPPLVDVGDGPFNAPDELERSDTPVHIEVPPDLEHIFPVTSLAMYLDAEVRPGDDPLLIADGTEHELDGDAGFETTVQRTLEQVFFFDCVARTDGLYLLDLHERAAVDHQTSLDLTSLYSQSLATQVNAYLSEPWDMVKDLKPTWKLTADVAPAAKHAAYLPFAANDLAHVRVPTTEPTPTTDDELVSALEGFERSSPIGTPTEFQATDAHQPTIVTTDPVESIEHAWVGEGVPIGASKPTAEACRRQLDPVGEGTISVQVIANAPEMHDERVVSELYGLRDIIEMDVRIDEEQTVDQTRSLLQSETDFVHYIGHVTDAGLQCADGFLDAWTLDGVEMRAFVLNACRSYSQGRALIDAGAVGGVVTLSNVTNASATVVGRQIAQLLNSGFSMSAALDVVGSETITGRQYVIVGDGNVALAEPKSGGVVKFDVDTTGVGVDLTYSTYPTAQWPLGSVFSPHIGENTRQYLGGGPIETFSTTRVAVAELFSECERLPVRWNDNLYWSDEVVFENES